jgi:1-acyl-sn-glycerol-3-phosphate acyltransferase
MLLPAIPESMPRNRSFFWAWLGRVVLRLKGWTIQGQLPKDKKLVLIVAPHTSNWDFVIGMAAKMALRLEANWLGKHSIFVGPADKIFRGWGGIPVERSEHHDMVGQVVEQFNARDTMWLGMSPEGTRKHVDHWKSGFWHIAHAANVPIQTIYFDFSRRILGIGDRFETHDDVKQGIADIRRYFKSVGIGKYREGE